MTDLTSLLAMLFPRRWFWLASDGRLYSAEAGGLVPDTAPAYLAFIEAGAKSTPWPRDDAGTQTDAALDEVLRPHGLRWPTPDPLVAAKTEARLAIVRFAQATAERVTGPVPPDEKHSWPSKEIAARALLLDAATDGQVAMIATEAQARGKGETPVALAARIVANADLYMQGIALISGFRKRAEDAVNAAESPEAVMKAVQAERAAAEKAVGGFLAGV